MQIKSACLALLISTSIVSIQTGCSSQPAAEPTPMPKTAPMPIPKPVPMSMPATMATADVTVLKFNDASIKAIQAGTKTATVRKGVRLFRTPTARAVGTGGGIVMLDIVSAMPKKMSELTAGDATANGSASLDVLKAQLGKDYPHISDSDVVTVIVFKLKANSGM